MREGWHRYILCAEPLAIPCVCGTVCYWDAEHEKEDEIKGEL